MQTNIVADALEQFLTDVQTVLPDLITGLVFLVIAAVTIKVVMFAVRAILEQALPGEAPVYRQFIATIVLVFLWFGVALSFLSIVGLTLVAASLGTATGFLALGVSYALSGMIADAVAGVYLLRDPDFNPGDTVTAGDTTGEVTAIELRKTRFDVEGDTVVRANADIEKRWTKVSDDA
ncbi:mechanosensitive ion channel family protein [Halomicroarcula sp. F13]|uniref:Mechanosensitive ion channel family protein n=1 Tax=Haloarcula rubra TaxID=2487747 RepID=A0AAW4PQP4_9EURY|nr:mechanosensitive ion channel domain-containing protein [Halomicroarcula rubra]MBX0323511.1 mechanosensitive ion channel family protein [Halomicroarcula rubra]